MKKCIICGSSENVIDHHTNYEKNIVVKVCRKCHVKIHSRWTRDERFRKFSPVDRPVSYLDGKRKQFNVLISEEAVKKIQKISIDRGTTSSELVEDFIRKLK